MPDRKIKLGTNCFLHFNDEYLFLVRDKSKEIDPGLLNGVGGKLESDENFVEGAIREVFEETGIQVEEKDMKLSSIVRLEDGYKDDWVMCFFKIKVYSKEIPVGHKTPDGELIWIHKDKVNDAGYKLVDDINFVLNDIFTETKISFMNARLNEEQKVIDVRMSKL